jgi:hypothetical protein
MTRSMCAFVRARALPLPHCGFPSARFAAVSLSHSFSVWKKNQVVGGIIIIIIIIIIIRSAFLTHAHAYDRYIARTANTHAR